MPRTLFPLALAVRNLSRNTRRTYIALAAIAAGVVAFAVAGGFIHWILVNFREYTIHSLVGHVQISRPADATGATRFLPEGGPVLDRIRSIPHVIEIAPRLAFQGLIGSGEATGSFVGTGVDPPRERELSRTIATVAGKDLSSASAREAYLGEGLADTIGAKPGAKVVLLANTRTGGINAVELTVAGTFASVTKAYDDSALRVPIEVARELARAKGSDLWVVLLDDTDATDRAVAALRAVLPPAEYEVRPWNTVAEFYNKTVELYSTQLLVVRTIIAIIIVLSISNTMFMSILERTPEIGTVLALGVSRWHIVRDFMLEALVLGAVGGLLGVALAALVASIATRIGIPMPPSPGMRHGFTAGIWLTLPLCLEAILLGIVPTVLAAVLPAWKATRLPIVDALRYNR